LGQGSALACALQPILVTTIAYPEWRPHPAIAIRDKDWNHTRMVGPSCPETGFEEISTDLVEDDFWTTSKCAIKCRTRSAVTQAEAAIAIATSRHR